MSIEVPPEINVTDRPAILWVGRDPGLNEANQRRPFVGRAGDKLMDGLNQAGLRRKDCNFANLVPWKPWNDDFWRHTNEDIRLGQAKLERLIKKQKPSLVVALGNEASFALIPEYGAITGSRSIRGVKGITGVRGFFFWNEALQVWVLSSFHPSAVLYQASQQFQFFVDCRRAALFHQGDLPRQEMPVPSLIRTRKDMDKFSNQTLTAFDIETEWGGTKLLCIAYCGDDLQPSVGYGSALRTMQPYLASNAPKIAHNGKFDRYYLEHHADTPVGGLNDDTMSLHWAMFPELAGQEDTGAEQRYDKKKKTRMTRKGLLFLASMYLNVAWWKNYDHKDIEKMALLCAQDVWVTRMLYSCMYPEAEKLDVIDQYHKNIALLPSLIATQNRGILIDDELRRDRIKKLKARRKKALAKINKAALSYIVSEDLKFYEVTKRCKCCNGSNRCWRCSGLHNVPKRKADYEPLVPPSRILGDYTIPQLKAMLSPCVSCEGRGTTSWHEFNFRSSQQIGHLMFEVLGAPKSCIVKGGLGTADTLHNVYENWATQPTKRKALAANRAVAEEILAPYFIAKKDSAQIDIYNRLKPAPDGKIRTELSPYRVTTSRFASSASFIIASTNLQNLSKGTAYEDPLYAVRECLIPEPGYAFILADYEKAEAVIAAADSEDWVFYDKLIAGEDIHNWHAQQYFGVVNEVNRQICKEVTYASAYIATAATVQQRINRNYYKTGLRLDIAEVERIHRSHLDLHPLEVWWDTVLNEARANNWWQENPFGLRRQFTNPNFHDRWKQMVNWRCQSTVASAINHSWQQVWDTLDTPSHYLVHQVHDEIMMMVRTHLVQGVAIKLKSIMEQPFTMRGRQIHIPVEVCVAYDNWHNKEKVRC